MTSLDQLLENYWFVREQDKEKYEEINEFLIEELFARERRMDAMMQVKRDKLFSKKSSKKKSKKKVDEQATQKAA